MLVIFQKDVGRIPKNLAALGHCGVCVSGWEVGKGKSGKRRRDQDERGALAWFALQWGIFGSFESMTHLRSQILYVCMYVCYAGMIVCVCVCVCVLVPEQARGHPKVPSAFFSSPSLSLALNSSRRLIWLLSKPRESSCLSFPNTRTISLQWLPRTSVILYVIRGA